jgi:hypothetical protein
MCASGSHTFRQAKGLPDLKALLRLHAQPGASSSSRDNRISGYPSQDQSLFQHGPLCRVDNTFKYRILDPLPEILTRTSHPAQAALTLSLICGNIIAYNYKHVSSSLPDKRGIAIEVTPQIPGHQHCLHVRQKTDRDLLLDKRVQYLLLFALLIGNENDLSCVVIHPYGP